MSKHKKNRTMQAKACNMDIDWSGFTEQDYTQMFRMETGIAGIVRMQDASFQLLADRRGQAGRTQLIVQAVLSSLCF